MAVDMLQPADDASSQAMALYEEAQQDMAQDKFEAARRKLRQAHILAPQDMMILDALGAFLAEAGPQQEAITALQQAVQKQPDQGFEKYMYLGQLLEGPEAVSSIRNGVAVLQQQQTAAEGEEREEATELLAEALCSLAELLLGTAEDVSTVAAECQQVLATAGHLQPDSPQPLQVLASLKVELQKPDEALQHLRDSMQKWFPALQRMLADPDESEADESNPDESALDEDEQDLDAQLPSFEFRFETAKLLIELDETTEAAVQILDSLIEEDDSVPNVWYMLAMCLLGGGQTEAAAEALQHGRKLLKKQADAEELAKDFSDLKIAIDEAAKEQTMQDDVAAAS